MVSNLLEEECKNLFKVVFCMTPQQKLVAWQKMDVPVIYTLTAVRFS